MEDAKLQAIHDHLSAKKQERGRRGGLGKGTLSSRSEPPPPAPAGDGHVYFSDDDERDGKQTSRKREKTESRTKSSGESLSPSSPLYAFFVRGGTLAPSVPAEQDALEKKSCRDTPPNPHAASASDEQSGGVSAKKRKEAPASSKKHNLPEVVPDRASEDESEKKSKRKKKRSSFVEQDAEAERVRCVSTAKQEGRERNQDSSEDEPDASLSASSCMRLSGLPLLRLSLSRACAPPSSLRSFALQDVLSHLLQIERVSSCGASTGNAKQGKPKAFLIMGGVGRVDRVLLEVAGNTDKLKKATLRHISGLLQLDSGESGHLNGTFMRASSGVADDEEPCLSGSFRASTFILPKKGEVTLYGFALP
ncbi:UNVERIFIED_CONTAM: hypothetical protein HHA_202760 [Hammondia hammondi]|eukprot:XP_008884563.1 hypothetical protein HHA_202760 [Hammondia hammondi]